MALRKIALALPLMVGVACQTSGGSKSDTASAQDPSTDTSTAQAGTAGDTSTGGATSGQGSVDPYATGSTGASASTGAASGASGSGDMTGTGSMGGKHGELKGHASDDVVSGTVQQISSQSIDIQSSGGQKKTLRIAPETLVTVDGLDAKASQLVEGQEVRASFDTVDGKETAVRIEAGMPSSSGMGSGSWDSGSTGTGSTSTGGSSSTGDTTQPGADTTGSGSTGVGTSGGTGAQ